MRLNRRTSLCLAVKAGWACFFGMYKQAREANVEVGDSISVTYTAHAWETRPGAPWYECKQKR